MKSTQEKRKKTCLNKYGTEHSSQNKDIKEKTANTCIGRFGHKTNLLNKNQIDKIKQTNLEVHGVDNPFKSERVKQKIKHTNLERYGTENPMQNEEIKKKSIQTNIEKYGYSSHNQSEAVKEKKKQTCLKNYGVEHWAQTEHARKIARLNILKNISENDNQIVIGKLERECLDILQNIVPFVLVRNSYDIGYSIGYFPDGYIKELKLLIEFDERQHFIDDYKTYTARDIQRELVLAAHCSCIIYRIKKCDWIKDQQKEIKKFKNLVQLLEI